MKRKRIMVIGLSVVVFVAVVIGIALAGGDVLIGWSFFQDASTETEPSGYFRKRGWFEDIF